MLEFRNFGKKSLNEIKDILDEMDLHFGMTLEEVSVTDSEGAEDAS
jgi:DNA-directed RNA polymerase subunit alpha